jgi:hypothetical protein
VISGLLFVLIRVTAILMREGIGEWNCKTQVSGMKCSITKELLAMQIRFGKEKTLRPTGG